MAKKRKNNLNEEVEEYLKKHWTRVPDEHLVDEPVYFVLEDDLKALAKHFANWGRKHVEMEGEILENFDGPVLDFDENEMAEKLEVCGFKTFDKVKITIDKI